jgi:hypothetical protein
VSRNGEGPWLVPDTEYCVIAVGPRTIEAAPPVPGGHPGRTEIDEREQG